MSAIFKRTKILATLGPATSTADAIKKLHRAGVNGFRLNFSHGDYSERNDQIRWIREASRQTGKPVAILQDLQGPKIRLGVLAGNHFEVRCGEEIILDYAVTHHDGSSRLPVQYNLAAKVAPGEPLSLFDGKIRTTVEAIESDTAIRLRIETDGVLMSRKGINLPETDFSGDILTPKDLRDIEYGLAQDIDFVALSFVQCADDVNNLRQILTAGGSQAQVIAKIETKAAIRGDVMRDIVEASDGIMVARGDLAVEAGAEVVPIVQRRLISLCREYGKLVIVATQMMESMVDRAEPTRAEVNDVANAVIQGADAVMLSDETAIGAYPFEVVATMKRTILYTQDHAPVAEVKDHTVPANAQRDAISAAAVQLAEQLRVEAIIAETKTGGTATNIACYRPNLPIISVTSEPRAAQQLALNYANRSFIRPDGEHAGIELARDLKNDDFFGQLPARVIVVSGREPGLEGATDTIRVQMIE